MKRALYRSDTGEVKDLDGNEVFGLPNPTGEPDGQWLRTSSGAAVWDAATAADIPFTPGGTISATDVQAAIEEVAAEAGGAVSSVFTRTGAVTAATSDYDAAQVDFTPAGTIAATNTQAAVEEVASDAAAAVSSEASARAAADAALVPKSLFDANTILKADSDDTPAALTMGASTILARLAAGNIVAATPSELRTLLALVIGTNVEAWDADLDTLANLNGATGKTTPVDADLLALADSAASFAIKKLTGTDLKAYLKTYFDTLYAATGGSGAVQYDYVERTTGLTVTATSDATAQAFISGSSVAYNGTTRVKIEAFIPYAALSINQAAVINLYDGSTDLGRWGQIQSLNATGGSALQSLCLVRYLTPSNASHAYNVKAWKTGGTVSLGAGAGGTATDLPAFLRITLA